MSSSPEPRNPRHLPPSADPYPRKIVSFAQRSGRLKPRLQRAIDNHGETYLIDTPRDNSRTSISEEFVLDPVAIFTEAPHAPLILEIGSGRGETMEAACAAMPDHNFVACEVYPPGIAQTVSRLAAGELTNAKIIEADAVPLLTYTLPPASLDELWVFFPDPWHKARHNKRRMVNDSFVELAARVLKPGGLWRLATDWADYADQMAEVIGASDLFAGGRVDRFPVRPVTRFEGIALDKGRDIADFTYRRV